MTTWPFNKCLRVVHIICSTDFYYLFLNILQGCRNCTTMCTYRPNLIFADGISVEKGLSVKKLFIPGAAAIAAAALSLFLGGGVAQAQEATQPEAPVQIPAVNIADAIDVSAPEAPAEPAAPVNEVLNFLADSINLAGRDVLQKHVEEAVDATGISKLLGTVETATFLNDEEPVDGTDNGAGTEEGGFDIASLAPFLAIPVGIALLAVPGALAGGVGGAAVAVFAGLAAAAIVIAPAVIAGLAVATVPALAIALVAGLVGLLPAIVFIVAGIVAVVSAIVVGLLVITWPLWVPAGIIMAVLGTVNEAIPGLQIAGFVFLGLGLLPGIALVAAGLLFGVTAFVALLSLPLVGLSVFLFSVALFVFLGIVALIGSLGLLPAIVAFVVVGLIAAVVTIPVGAIIGLGVGGVAGAFLGGLIAVILYFVLPRVLNKDEEEEAENNNTANQKDFALAA